MPSSTPRIDSTFSDDLLNQFEHETGYTFDAERRNVLREEESAFIEACPGSGKTTVLGAKLILLNRSQPHLGICVLSHTNVAREQIERMLQGKQTSVLRYPHFVGTIQSFADRFLGIPEFLSRHDTRPTIDSDVYTKQATFEYRQIPFGLRTYFRKRAVPGNDGSSFLASARYDTANIELLSQYRDNTEHPLSLSPTTHAYHALKDAKDRITAAGFVGYEDMYAYAMERLRLYPFLVDILSKRFSLVLVDEMQDTAPHQFNIIEAIFRDRSVIQYCGDSRQCLYVDSHWQLGKPLTINNSLRYSDAIARLCDPVAIKPAGLKGLTSATRRAHSLILFEPAHIDQVLPAFCEIIRSSGLPIKSTDPYVAVGMVAKPNQDPSRLSITSYAPYFREGLPPLNVAEYVDVALSKVGTHRNLFGVAQYVRRIAAAVATAILNRPLKADERRKLIDARFNIQIAECVIGLTKLWAGQISREYWRDLLLGLCRDILGVETEEILDHPFIQVADGRQLIQPANIFVSGDGVEIQIRTIKGAKGQTHAATLVLDTYYHNSMLEAIIPYLINQPPRKHGKRMIQDYLPHTYVGMTRPRELVCLAMQSSDSILAKVEQFEKQGWKIVYC
jgi:DNA helicase-2/ATP-dependent DNA helicase PcrA